MFKNIALALAIATVATSVFAAEEATKTATTQEVAATTEENQTQPAENAAQENKETK